MNLQDIFHRYFKTIMGLYSLLFICFFASTTYFLYDTTLTRFKEKAKNLARADQSYLAALVYDENMESVSLALKRISENLNGATATFSPIEVDEKLGRFSYPLSFGGHRFGHILFTFNLSQILGNWLILALNGLFVLGGIISFLVYKKANRHIIDRVINPLSMISERIKSIDSIRSNKSINKLSLPSLTSEEVKTIYSALQDSFIRLKENEERFAQSEKEHTKHKAIAQTTQILAHDVRKPFTMIKGLIDILESSKDQEQTRTFLSRFTPEVNKAIVSVNGMIADIMEVGSDTKLTTKPADPKRLIDSAVNDHLIYRQNSGVNFSYKLNHTRKVDVDSLKVMRVFSNIIDNAYQAMRNKGNIWFRTKDTLIDGVDFIEFCIGNDGSSILPSDLLNLFDMFFTKNKKGGTGLGLAIAKKIIEAHGGSIRCESSQSSGVEFYFTVPAPSLLSI